MTERKRRDLKLARIVEKLVCSTAFVLQRAKNVLHDGATAGEKLVIKAKLTLALLLFWLDFPVHFSLLANAINLSRPFLLKRLCNYFDSIVSCRTSIYSTRYIADQCKVRLKVEYIYCCTSGVTSFTSCPLNWSLVMLYVRPMRTLRDINDIFPALRLPHVTYIFIRTLQLFATFPSPSNSNGTQLYHYTCLNRLIYLNCIVRFVCFFYIFFF